MRQTATREVSDAKAVLDTVRELLDSGEQSEAILQIVSQLLKRNAVLEKLVALIKSRKNRSEKISVSQLEMFLQQVRADSSGTLGEANAKLEAAATDNGGREEPITPPKQPPVRKPPPATLPRVDNPIPVPPEERKCPKCGSQRVTINHEVTEVIDLIPAKVIVRVDRREVCACKSCDAELTRAPQGDKVVKGGAYGAALVSQLVVDKYAYSMTIERVRKELERLGLSLSSSTASDQIMWATDLLMPIWRALETSVLQSNVMHIDGTSLPVRDKDTQFQVQLGSLWGCVGDSRDAFYFFSSTAKAHGQRDGEVGPEEFLAKRRGPIVADAGSVFRATFQRSDVFEVGCNMHARRKFVQAHEAGDHRASLPIKAFQTLYDVEHDVRDKDEKTRFDGRNQRSKPTYLELIAWCKTFCEHEPPSSLLAKAAKYLLNHAQALTRFLDDGSLPIDNGIIERLHRVPAVGRRNFLFAGSYAGGMRAAIAYSVIGSCELTGVNPLEYLTDILPQLAAGRIRPADMANWLPAAWLARRA